MGTLQSMFLELVFFFKFVNFCLSDVISGTDNLSSSMLKLSKESEMDVLSSLPI